MTGQEGRGGPRPFLGWADELQEFEAAFRALDPLESRRPDPALERMLEEQLRKAAPVPSWRATRELRELVESGTVHHPGATSSLFADVAAEQQREGDQVHAMRLAVEGMVARYAAEHPGEIRP